MKRLLLVVWLVNACDPVYAQIPADANHYKRDLIRVAHSEWGLDAPVSTFAAQIHQESGWREDAQSYAGAQGLAQFIPGTSNWISGLYKEQLGDNQPYNPVWAMRALVIYNAWHYQRIRAATNCDRWAFTLSAYNGGLGWVQRDRKQAALQGMDSGYYWGVVEQVNSGRSSGNFKENRDYPSRIIYRWQPLYQNNNWGAGVCH